MSRLATSMLVLMVFVFLPATILAFDETTDNRPTHDPFKVLVKKPRKPVPPRPIQPQVEYPKPQVVPPLNLKVNAIAGKDGNFVAVIQYKGSDYIVEKGWESEDRNFRVMAINKDGVEVHYSKAKARRNFVF